MEPTRVRAQTKSAFRVLASHMLESALQSRLHNGNRRPKLEVFGRQRLMEQSPLHPLERFCQNRDSQTVASILQVGKNARSAEKIALWTAPSAGRAPKPWSHRQIGKCLAAMSHIKTKALILNAKHLNFVVDRSWNLKPSLLMPLVGTQIPNPPT